MEVEDIEKVIVNVIGGEAGLEGVHVGAPELYLARSSPRLGFLFPQESIVERFPPRPHLFELYQHRAGRNPNYLYLTTGSASRGTVGSLSASRASMASLASSRSAPMYSLVWSRLS